MKTILITGGAGFIGSEFVRKAAKRGYSIIVIDSITYAGDMYRLKGFENDFTFCKGSITNLDFIDYIFKKERPYAVVHWAAESHVDRSIVDASPFWETNINGTQILLDASRRYGVERFINISTDEVYGELKADGQFYETTPLKPNSPYSISKASADMLGRVYHRMYGLPVITVRPSNNYGPWQYPEKLIPVVIMKALNNKKIPVYGTGENIREWLFVSDCVNAVFSVLEGGIAGEIYNIGSGTERKNIEVVTTILKLLGKREDLIEFVEDRLGHDYRYSLNSKKIREQLGWVNNTLFDYGIEQTVEWYMDNIQWIQSKNIC